MVLFFAFVYFRRYLPAEMTSLCGFLAGEIRLLVVLGYGNL